MICNAKHTAFQPTEEQWVCPKCGDKDFCIEEPDHERTEDCDKIHCNDEILCGKCGYAQNGKNVAVALQKIYHRKTCPTCKGEGTVPE